MQQELDACVDRAMKGNVDDWTIILHHAINRDNSFAKVAAYYCFHKYWEAHDVNDVDYDAMHACAKASLTHLWAHADENCSCCQFYLGVLHEKGLVGEEGAAEAVKLYQVYELQGNRKALLELAKCLMDGRGIQKDEQEAMRWYEIAANQQVAEAQCFLGTRYFDTDHFAEAFHLFQTAADQNFTDAQAGLGICYLWGKGVDKDAREALRLFQLAADQNNANAQFHLGRCYDADEDLNEILETDISEAVRFYQLAAAQNQACAQAALASKYMTGEIVNMDLIEAARLFSLGANNNGKCMCAQMGLGECFAQGAGLRQSFEESASWYRKAAEQGYDVAQHRLGMCYFRGEGVAKNDTEAKKWLRLAADQGYSQAISDLSQLFELA
jgi:TPR repeat protein